MKKTLVLIVMLVMLISCFFGRTLVMANGEESGPQGQRYYTSIEIRKGDTLWSIAGTYRKGSGMSTKEYIKELKRMNQIQTDAIDAGDFLTVVYYAESPKEMER